MEKLQYLSIPVNVFICNTDPNTGRKYPSVNSYFTQPCAIGSLNSYVGTPEAHNARLQKSVSIKAYKAAKIYCPCVQISSNCWPSSTLPRSNLQALQGFSGFICIDVDDYDGPIDQWVNLCGCVAYGKSVGGNGYYFIFRTTYTFKAVKQFSEWIEREVFPLFNGLADPACKDIQRLRFLGIDPIIFTHTETLIDAIVNPPCDDFPDERLKALHKLNKWDYRQKQLENVGSIASNHQKHIALYKAFLWIAEDVKAGDYTVTKEDIINAAFCVWGEDLNGYEIDSLENALAKVGVSL